MVVEIAMIVVIAEIEVVASATSAATARVEMIVVTEGTATIEENEMNVVAIADNASDQQLHLLLERSAQRVHLRGMIAMSAQIRVVAIVGRKTTATTTNEKTSWLRPERQHSVRKRETTIGWQHSERG